MRKVLPVEDRRSGVMIRLPGACCDTAVSTATFAAPAPEIEMKFGSSVSV